MRNAFTILLVPALLLLGSMTAFAGDGILSYKPVTEPPVISNGPAPIIPLDNRDRMAFRNEIQVPAASFQTLPPVKSADPSAVEREKGIAAGKSPDSFQDPGHNHGAH